LAAKSDGKFDGFKKSMQTGNGIGDAIYQKQKALAGMSDGKFDGFKKIIETRNGGGDALYQKQKALVFDDLQKKNGREEYPDQKLKTLAAKSDGKFDDFKKSIETGNGGGDAIY